MLKITTLFYTFVCSENLESKKNMQNVCTFKIIVKTVTS